MNQRKWIALVLVLSLLLAGCGSKEPERGTIKPAETINAAKLETAPAPHEAPATAAEKPVTLGTMEGGIYENAYAGFGCVLGDGWTYKTAEEIQDLSELTNELLEGSAVDVAGSGLQQIQDMVAENSEQMLGLNVLYQQLTVQEQVAYAVMSEEQVIDSILEGADAIISSYEQIGMENITMEKVTVTFLGETRCALHTSATIQGVGYYILQLFDYEIGQYGVFLTFNSLVEDCTESMLDLFYPV